VSEMTPLEELSQLASERSRRIFLARSPVDLSSAKGENTLYVLQLPTSSGSAGGRIGGIGERRIDRLFCFRQLSGQWTKVFETDETSKLEQLDLPYHASGLSVILTDGTEKVVSGVIDEELVQRYDQTFS
jgi:hypothetical protein